MRLFEFEKSFLNLYRGIRIYNGVIRENGDLSVFFNVLSAKTRPLSVFYLFMENHTKKAEENQSSSTFIIKITIFIDYFYNGTIPAGLIAFDFAAFHAPLCSSKCKC